VTKSNEKQDQAFEAAARAQFATDVIKLYKAALNNQVETCADSSLEVRQVAFGLVALRQALDPYLHKYRNDPLRFAAAGGWEATAILDALTSGRDHALWKHIDGIRSALYRPGAAPPVQQEQQRREMLAGVVLAYQEKTGSSRREAARAVCAGIKSPDFPFSADQLRKWVDRYNGETHAKRFLIEAADVPDCDSDGERILIVGRATLHGLLAVPGFNP
jgi:hypothetical protein